MGSYNYILNHNYKNIAIINSRIQEKSCKKLYDLGYTTIKLPKHPNLPDGICQHPDIQLCVLPSGTIVYSKQCNSMLISKIENFGIKTHKGINSPSHPYPHDVPFNVAVVGKYFFHKKNLTDTVLLEILYKEGLELIEVNQGYSKCSVVVVSSSAIITADPSIYKAADKKGIDVLFIEDQSPILLEGFSHGFIGGCTGLDSKNRRLFFTGSLSTLGKQEYAIREFCNKYQVEVIQLSNERLTDFGSIFFL